MNRLNAILYVLTAAADKEEQEALDALTALGVTAEEIVEANGPDIVWSVQLQRFEHR